MAEKSKEQKVWEKGKPIKGKDPDVWRKDATGKTIRRGSHGTAGKYAWEMDHKHPKSKGGSDGIKNLQPLHRDANRAKADKLPRPRRRK